MKVRFRDVDGYTILVLSDIGKEKLISELNSAFICYYNNVYKEGAENSPRTVGSLEFLNRMVDFAKAHCERNEETKSYEVELELGTGLLLFNTYIEMVNEVVNEFLSEKRKKENDDTMSEQELRSLPSTGMIN